MASWNAGFAFPGGPSDRLPRSPPTGRLSTAPNLADFEPSSVWVGGEEVARDGRALFENHDEVPVWMRDTVRLGHLGPASLVVPASSAFTTARVRAMEMYDGYYKRAFEVDLPVVDGHITPAPAIDVAKIVIIDRHHGSTEAGIGFVCGSV